MIPEPLLLITGCLLCGAIGALGVHLYYRARLAAKEHESWRQARLFYSRLYAKQDRF